MKSIRKQKEHTFLHIMDGSNDHIQVVIPTAVLAGNCTFNSAVEVCGRLVKSPKAKQPVEVQGQTLSILGPMDLDAFPFTHNRAHPFDYTRQYIHLRPKTNIARSILRLSSLIANSLQQSLISEGYINVFTPVLTSNDCEGSGEVFMVRPASDQLCQQMSSSKGDNNEAFFNKKVYLTVSGQLHLEAIAGYLYITLFLISKNPFYTLFEFTEDYPKSLQWGPLFGLRIRDRGDIWLNSACWRPSWPFATTSSHCSQSWNA